MLLQMRHRGSDEAEADDAESEILLGSREDETGLSSRCCFCCGRDSDDQRLETHPDWYTLILK